MKKLFFLLALISISVSAQTRRVRVVNTIDELVSTSNNPLQIDTNIYVADTNRGGLFSTKVASGVVTNLGTKFLSQANTNYYYDRLIDGPLNLKWFGALGDGTNDDTIAIQAACSMATTGTNLAQLQGVDIYAPPGIYKISAPIILHTGTKFRGAGRVKTQFLNLSTTNDSFVYDGTPINAVSTPITLSDFWIFGRDNATAGAGFRFLGNTNNIAVDIQNVFIYGHYDGFIFSHVVGGQIIENWTLNTVHDSFTIGGGTTTLLVAGNIAQTSGRYGWYIHDSVYCSFNANASDIHQTGWYMTNVSNLNFSGNGAEAFSEDGVHAVNVRNTSFDNFYAQGLQGSNGCRSAIRLDGGFALGIKALRAEIPIGSPQLEQAIVLTNAIMGSYPAQVYTSGQINFPIWNKVGHTNGEPNRPDLLVSLAPDDQYIKSTFSSHKYVIVDDIWLRNNGGQYLALSNAFGLLLGSNTNNYALLQLNGTNGASKDVGYANGGILRWLARSSGIESGGNSGSDFSIFRFNDDGTQATNALYINRSSGFTAIGNSTAPGWQLDVFGSANVRGTLFASGQTGIGTAAPDASAKLEVNSTNSALLFPRMTTTQRNAIGSPTDGLIFYNTTVPEFQQRVNGAWLPVGNSGISTNGALPYLFLRGNFDGGTTWDNTLIYSNANDTVAAVVGATKRGRLGSATNSPASGGILGQFRVGGWDTTTYVLGGGMFGYATENWLAGKNGTELRFHVVSNTTDIAALAMTIGQDKMVKLESASAPNQYLGTDGNGKIITVALGAVTATNAYTTVFEENSPLTARTNLAFIGSAITATDNGASNRTDVTINSRVNAVADQGGTGLYAMTGVGSGATRTLTAGNSGINIVNGNGISGNPTIYLNTNAVNSIYRTKTLNIGADTAILTLTPDANLAGFGGVLRGTIVAVDPSPSEVYVASFRIPFSARRVDANGGVDGSAKIIYDESALFNEVDFDDAGGTYTGATSCNLTIHTTDSFGYSSIIIYYYVDVYGPGTVTPL